MFALTWFKMASTVIAILRNCADGVVFNVAYAGRVDRSEGIVVGTKRNSD